jgi:glycosyl transferase family 87
MRRSAGALAAAAGVFGLSLLLLWRGGGDGDTAELQRYGDAVVSGGQLPYRDFHLEYPPGAVPFFTVPSIGPAHEYLTIFRLVAIAGVLLGLVLLALLLEHLDAPAHVRWAALLFAAVSPALLGAFTLRRFDAWPAALCVGVLLLLLADRPLWAFALLAVATLVKTYPAALLPVALLATPRPTRIRAIAVFCAVGLVVLVPLLALAHVGLYLSYSGQWNRHLQLETFGASALLALHRGPRIAFDSGSWSVFGSSADSIAKLQTLAQVVGVLAAAWLFARSRRTGWDLAAAAATTVAVAAVAGKVLSPQFLLWLAPLVVVSRSILATGLSGAAMLLTNPLFPDRYDGLIARHGGEIALLVVRNVLLVAMLGALFAAQSTGAATLSRRG